jgi:ribosomal protein S18 acetylase RimI-like enzyme/pimeloyl-ACP methyl ester carboxylesterase
MGYLFLAALSIAISLLLRFASQQSTLVAEHRAVRNHLIEFMRVWLALSVYYLLQPLVKLLPAANPATRFDCLVGYLPPPFLWHFCVALTLGFANIWLRRAVLELEISELPQNKGRLVLPLETLGSWQPLMKWCTEEGILFGFLLALLPLGFIPSLTSSRFALSLAYSVQLLATSLLFVRLGFAYKSILGSRILFALSIVYAVVQLPYGMLIPAGTFSNYELPLGLTKVIHGLSLVVICLSYAKRQDSQEERPTEESLARLAKRLQSHAILSGIRQLMIGGALVMLTLLLLAGLYSCTINRLKTQGYAELQLLFVRLLFGIMLLLAWQACGYFVLAKLRFRVSLTDDRALLRHFNITVQEPGAGVPGIEVVSFTRVKIPDQEDGQQQQVILLHGLFSSGAAAWGLLPLVLLREGRVSCVRRLTYSHGLLTSRRNLDQISKDIASKIGSLILDFPGRTIMIGHSLGGVIALKILPELIRKHPSGLSKGLHHVGIVGAPLLGSSFAKTLFPWPWSRMLGRHSRLLEETLRDALSVIPPVGSAEDGERFIPSLTFIYGSRDSVAGELVQFAAFHGEKIRAPAFHGLGLVFIESQELAHVYQRMLSAVPRAVALARAIGDGVLAKEKQYNANGVFVFSEELRLASAQLVGSLHERSLGMEQSFVEHRLKKLYQRNQERAIMWETYWHDLEKELEHSATPVFLLRAWSEDQVLFLYANRFAGFFAIMPGAGRWPGDMPKKMLKATSLGPISSAIVTTFKELDPAAVSAVLFESCGHQAKLRAESISTAKASFTTVIDSEGTYYGLYALDGEVDNERGIDHIYVHIGAPGQPLSLEELEFGCYDEESSSALQVELTELGRNCWLCRLNLGSHRKKGAKVKLRLSFRRQNCVNLVRGFELFRLEPLLSAGARVYIRLYLPDRPVAIDAFKVGRDKLEILNYSRSDEPLERRYVYSAEAEVEMGDKAMGIRFNVHMVTAERRRLRNVVTVDRARREDLSKIAGMEALLSVRVAANLDDLYNRLMSFPDGMLVARIGDEVIGYIQFVLWNRARMTTFREVSPIHSHHDADGTFAFIWFLGVLPAFRGRGIGRRLILEVVSWSENKSIRQLQIVAQSDLRGYFEAMGFKKIADIDEYMPSMTGVFMARGVVL